jgi:outer membrane protein TolC
VPSTGVSLPAALARAMEHGPLVRAARERQQAAVTARQGVPKLPNPLVELRGENFGPHDPSQLTHDVFATISQPIELRGKRAARTATADAVVAVADADFQAAQWSLAFEVAGLYVDALRAREVSATLAGQQASVADLLTTLSNRVREGVSAEADLRRLEAEHQRLARQALRTEIAARSALLRLSAVVGIDLQADQLLPVTAPAPELPAQLDASLVARRPDVEAARTRVARAEASLSVERARGVPDVVFTTGYKRTSGLDTGVAAVTLPINLFDRNRVAKAVATGEIAAARLELQGTEQLAVADAQAQVSAATRLAAQAAAAPDLLEPALVVRTAARAAYMEGRGDVLQLVDAERVYAETAREVIELQLDAALANFTARLSLGEWPLP